MNPEWRFLYGLPPYGAMPEQFSATGQGTHREGLVVELSRSDVTAWVGNFQRGMTNLDAFFASTGDATVTVIAGGQAYVIDPRARSCVRTFGGDIEHVLHIAGGTVFSNGLWLEATDGVDLFWRSQRLSWDGMMDVRLEGDTIVGNGYDAMTDTWAAFSVDVWSGEAAGGAYPLELPT